MPTAHEHATGIRPRRHARLFGPLLVALTIVSSVVLAVVPAADATSGAHHRHHHKHHRRRRRARAADGCPGANDRVGQAPRPVLQTAVVCLINQERTSRNLPRLAISPLLNRSAQGWTDAMVSTDQFTHGTDFAARISATGYDWRSAGENIATGFATPRSVVRAWMASTGHCQNILNPTYRNVGTGVSARAVSGYGTGGGTWTQDFALGMNQSPPSGNYGPADGCPY